ncbi:unnamed protein product, partial [Ectocarpus sp. 6 AP-2014]
MYVIDTSGPHPPTKRVVSANPMLRPPTSTFVFDDGTAVYLKT